MSEYDEKLQREQAWYTQSQGFNSRHVLNSRLFYSDKRVAYNSDFAKSQLTRLVGQVIQAEGLVEPRILVAPVGSGGDIPFLRPFSRRISVLDVSPEAINKITDTSIEKHLGDMKKMVMFPDGSFDIAFVSQFFHHFVRFGFDEFLKEICRVLRPGGHLFAFEPSIFHPVAFAALCVKKVVGNITGAVEDEAPFNPLRLTGAMKRVGFARVQMIAASYSHHRTPIPLARITNALTLPLQRCPVLKCFAYACGFHGRKSSLPDRSASEG